jgi:hypothetical protein
MPGRDFLLGDSPQYVYVGFSGPERTRLSTQIYTDPYQTKTLVRTLHFDLHGSPGSVIPTPISKTISYVLSTVEPLSNNVAQVSESFTVTANKDEEVTISLLASDANFDLLSYEITEQPHHGVVTPGEQAHQFRYTPSTGFVGSALDLGIFFWGCIIGCGCLTQARTIRQ